MECYSWTQTLSEVTVVVPVPPGTKGRSLDVLIAKQRLRVGVKGQPAIVDVSARQRKLLSGLPWLQPCPPCSGTG
jgi:hypothetical protein